MFTVQEVHTDFLSAEDRLLNEAQDLINNPKVDVALKSERVAKLGFGSSKIVKDATEIVQQSVKAPELIGRINYFKQHYPNNRFITEGEVKKLCEKYGLALGDASDYTGDIPEKNIVDIEKFVLRKEDWLPKEKSWLWSTMNDMNVLWYEQMMGSIGIPKSRMDTPKVKEGETIGVVVNKKRRSGGNALQNYVMGIDPYGAPDYKSAAKVEEETKTEYEHPKFKIVAPREDFANATGLMLIDGYILKDPIVLQPVKEGYLIVTAWGLEASDENIVNEKMN